MAVPHECCPGCGATFPASEGPTHRYIGASSGCWALYSALTAGQVPDPDLLARSWPPDADVPVSDGLGRRDLGPLLVDAYAAQHPGTPSPQAIQSVAVHVLALHAVFGHGQSLEGAMWARRRALRVRGVFPWLDMAQPVGRLTIRHLFRRGINPQIWALDAYVASVHDAWIAHHGHVIEEWYQRYVIADRIADH